MGKTYIGNGSSSSRAPKAIYYGNSSNLSKKVLKVYVGNSNGKSVKVWPNSIVPVEYRQVQYILNNEYEFIQTEIVPNQYTRFVIDMEPISFNYSTWSDVYGTGGVFGVYGASNSASSRYYLLAYNEVNTGKLYHFTYGEDTVNLISKFGTSLETGRHVYDLNRDYLGNSYIDNILVLSSQKPVTCTAGAVLFGIRQWNTDYSAKYVRYRLYHFSAYQDGDIISDMYPCYRIEDTVVGMWDTVRERFFDNDGRGTGFIKGPNV